MKNSWNRPSSTAALAGFCLILHACTDPPVDDDSTPQDAFVHEDADGDGWTPYDADCDDTDPTVHPGAEETCDGKDNDCDGEVPAGENDADGDGIRGCEGDCDDSAAEIHPGAEELCDERDGDCDGVVAAEEYDLDGDGVRGCEGDCDDGEETVSAGAEELCDGLDNDCDGHVDDWDDDGDGYSPCPTDGSDPDCDDVDPTVNPGATEVVDGVDNDCDGAVDGLWVDPDPGVASADAMIHGLTPAMGVGAALAIVRDTDGDGLDDIVVGARGDDTVGENAGAVYLFLTAPVGDVPVTSAAVHVYGEQADDHTPSQVASAGDVNGDGLGDVVVGTAYRPGGAYEGAAYVLLGPVPSGIGLEASDARLFGQAAGDEVGAAVAGGGDVNGDGLDDVIVGAPGDSTASSGAGAAHIWLGPVAGEHPVSEGAAVLLGASTGDEAGHAVAVAGDVDGDGFDDVLVGAPRHNAPATDAGAAFLVSGPVAGSWSLWNATARLTGEATDDLAGYSVGAAGDLDGDGHGDVLVGAPYESTNALYAGAVYVLHGPLSGAVPLSTATAKMLGEYTFDSAGCAVHTAGDVDGDGALDIVVGAYQQNGQAGTAYVVRGPLIGVSGLDTADLRLQGEASIDYAGWAVGGGGDLDGDGYDDFLVGASGADAGGNHRGAAYLFYGSSH